jgi:hypothetical protein
MDGDYNIPAPEQMEFWDPQGKWAKAFDEWVHSETGRIAAYRFIRIACGCQARGIRLGAKAIWERLRWNFMLRKAEGEKFKLNNNYTAYMARFAIKKVPGLAGYFELRETE